MLIITSRKGNTMGGNHRFGRTRSEIEGNLRKEWGSASWTEEQIDKAKHIEKALEIKEGLINTKIVDMVE
jgi:hypothetical protein